VIGEHTCEFLKRDAAMSQEARRSITVKSDDARLNANLRRFAEQHGVNATIELFEHMVGGGGGEPPKTIRAWRGDWCSRRANESQSRFVSRQAHANRLKTGTHQARNLWSRGGNDRERTWPKGIRKDRDTWIGERSLSEEVCELSAIGDVHDERIKGWATLRLKDACNRWRIESVRSKAVDRLGGEGDEPTCANDCRGAWHRFRSGVCGSRAQPFGDHAGRARSIMSAA
jgi:hypothetical protein